MRPRRKFVDPLFEDFMESYKRKKQCRSFSAATKKFMEEYDESGILKKEKQH